MFCGGDDVTANRIFSAGKTLAPAPSQLTPALLNAVDSGLIGSKLTLALFVRQADIVRRQRCLRGRRTEEVFQLRALARKRRRQAP